MTTTLQGLETIRSFQVEEQLINKFQDAQDEHACAWHLFINADRRLGLEVDLCICGYQLVILVITMLLPRDGIDPVLLSVSLMNALGLIYDQQYVIRESTLLENTMTSVERILEYTKLEQEASKHTSLIPAADWPSAGHIRFQQVNLYYDVHSAPALRDLTFNIKGGEKIGIVGRTGAGKSSLFSCLLRLVEPEGQIFIDDIDVTKLGLTDLRQQISVIPQNPVLFTGTFRYNLDPFSEYSDDQIWAVLEKVQLKDRMASHGDGDLDAQVTEEGNNCSVGEKQLLCLARAMLRSNKILIVDEATANVDLRTEQLIQKAIQEDFAHCTIIAIAHRLQTVIDSDRILVLDGGSICQFDHPHILLQDQTGLLYGIAKYGSKMEFENLQKRARESFTNKQHSNSGFSHQPVSPETIAEESPRVGSTK